MTKTFTPEEIAARFGVAPRKIRRWIEVGELSAIEISTRQGSRKPRWRISEEALQTFENRRSSSASAAPTPPRRRRRDTAVVEYF